MRHILNGIQNFSKKEFTSHYFFILLIFFIIGFFCIPERSLIHRNFYYIFIFLPALIIFFRDHKLKNVTHENLFLFILLFLLYMALSLGWSEHRTWNELFDATRYILLILSFPLVITLALRNGGWQIGDLLWWSMLGVSIVALITIITFYTNNSFPYDRLEGLGRTVSNPTTNANMHGLFAIIGLTFLVQNRKRVDLSLPAQTITLLSTFTLCSYVILTQTRGALLALIVATFLLLILNKKWKAIFLLALIAVATIASIELSESIRGLFERGLGTRPYIWLESLGLFAEKPLFGHGVATETKYLISLNGTTKTYENTHNILLHILVHYGLVGLFLWSLPTLYAIKSASCFDKTTKDWTLIVVLVYCLTAMMFNIRSILASPNAVWILYWLPIGLILYNNLMLKSFQKAQHN